MKPKKTYNQYLSSPLAMVVALVFCLTNTSGHIISPDQVIQASRVELVLEEKKTINESELYFSTSSSPINGKEYLPSILFDKTYLISYENLISVKYLSISRKLNTFKSITHFTQLKRIPQHSDDHFKS